MKGALLLALVAPTLAFVPVNKPVMPMAKVHSRKTAMQMSDSMAPLPGLASTPGQPTVEMWLMDNADKKLCKSPCLVCLSVPWLARARARAPATLPLG